MNNERAPDVSVVIPTAGEPARVESLNRAIDSILGQTGVVVDLLVVLNGDRYCPELRSTLSQRSDIRFLYLVQGDQTKAIAAGRKAVAGQYFCFLDDDDELIPDTLECRVDRLEHAPEADVLVSGGYRRNASTGEQQLMLERLEDNAADPLQGLARGNWLASCGGLFRTEGVDAQYFSDIPKYFEWTWLAIRLSLDKRIVFDQCPVFVINDTPGSLSKSTAYLEREINFIEKVLEELPVSRRFRRYLLNKKAAKYIGFANAALAEGCKRRAFGHYLDCLGSGRTGLTYLLWVRKLFYK